LKSHVSSFPLHEFPLWDVMRKKRGYFSFDLELTARCDNNCRHCYINLRRDDRTAASAELTLAQISGLADEAVSLGTFWCLVTGGEPLLRPDFPDIFLSLKRKGLLISVFTNATLIKTKHIELFKKFPPNLIEVTVYGITRETYEAVSRTPGSFRSFMNGLDLLLKNGIPVRLKAMALRSNAHELPAIREFCLKRTSGDFRFDPLLHLRYDRDPARNAEILAERLTPVEIVELEKGDPKRSEALRKGCDVLINPGISGSKSPRLFFCAAGTRSFCVGHDGRLRLCSSLWHPDFLYDLRKGGLVRALREFVPAARKRTSRKRAFRENCGTCALLNLCLWCPAHAYLECGELDRPVDTFCAVARARADFIRGGRLP
jgi:radical SAM protein with 4Fe4S-binding SPASM domain